MLKNTQTTLPRWSSDHKNAGADGIYGRHPGAGP